MPFTDVEIESLREIVGLNTSSSTITDLTSRLTALNTAQETASRADITAWNKIANGTVKSRGGIKGTDYDVERDRLHITNKVRLRLNYPRISGGIDKNEMGIGWLRATSWSGAPVGDENGG